MELVGENLDERVEEVRLRDVILAVDHLLEHPGKHRPFVQLQRHALQLRQHQQVLSHQVAKFSALLLAAFPVAVAAAVLHPHPQLVHLREVLEDKLDGVVDVAAGSLVLAAGVRQ